MFILIIYFCIFRSGQQLIVSQEHATGPGFICVVSGGLPVGRSKKIWTDKLKLMVGMRDMINRVLKTFPGLSPTDYMKVIVFGCQVIGKYILRCIEILIEDC